MLPLLDGKIPIVEDPRLIRAMLRTVVNSRQDREIQRSRVLFGIKIGERVPPVEYALSRFHRGLSTNQS